MKKLTAIIWIIFNVIAFGAFIACLVICLNHITSMAKTNTWFCIAGLSCYVLLTIYSVYCFVKGKKESKLILISHCVVEIIGGMSLLFSSVFMYFVFNGIVRENKVEIITQDYISSNDIFENYYHNYYVQFRTTFVIHDYSACSIYYHSSFYHKNTDQLIGVVPFELNMFRKEFDADTEYSIDIKLEREYLESNEYMFWQLYYHSADYYSKNNIKYVDFGSGITTGTYDDWKNV